MHSGEPKIRDVYYGADDDNLYLRLDLDEGFRFNLLELRTEHKTISLWDDSSVQFAKMRIVEIRVPFSTLGTASENRICFRLGIENETIPTEGWFDIASPS